jgi:UDP-N-acetylmuramyl pentapeptide phosphotransferase/UDP-N-acetylglucosamine-1-phosphate transferase
MRTANHKLISAQANPSIARVKRALGASGRSQNQQVRLWIITMLLVLFGLSTLKLRWQ